MSDPAKQHNSTPGYPGVLYVLGPLMGGMIGYLMRPSVFLIGQLPFSTVITRGARLHGLDMALLVPTAQQSFNYLALGFLAGLAVAYILVQITRYKATQH